MYYSGMDNKFYKLIKPAMDEHGIPYGPKDVGVLLWHVTDWKEVTDSTLNEFASALIPHGLTLYVLDFGSTSDNDYYIWGVGTDGG